MAQGRPTSTSSLPRPAADNRGVPPPYRVIAYLVRRLEQICQGMVAEALSGTDIGLLQLAVLAHIDDQPDIDQSRLADRASIDRTNTGRIVDQLEGMGLVDRRVNGSDRRARLLRLTERGVQLRRRLRPLARSAQESLLASLSSKEREVLIDLLVRVVKANEAYVRPGAGRRKPGARQTRANKSRPSPTNKT
jgi:DNA-binding MarR family transcriptional regulator